MRMKRGRRTKRISRRSSAAFRIEDLPEEILIDIFSRLSIKTIFTCRCVSKTWCTLLSSSNSQFTKLHFNRSPLQFILQTFYFRPICLYFVELEDDNDLDNIKLLPSRLRFPSYSFYAVNSCNGFLCLTTSYCELNPVKICNPITGEYLNLPNHKINFNSIKVVSGFGCSAKTNQYKVVRLVYKSKLDGMAEVHNVGTKSWRTIGTAPKFWNYAGSTTFFNGVIHWVCHNEHCSDLIISFDLETEKFDVIPPPPHLGFSETVSWKDRYNIKIGVLGEFLYLSHNMELWVMKKYGVGKSWDKVYVVDRSVEKYQAIKYLSGGKILINDNDEELISYDPEKKICKVSNHSKFSRRFTTIAHVPSLMSFSDAMMGDKGAKLRIKMC